MMAPAMNTHPDDRFAYPDLARQGAVVVRRLQADSLPRLNELAPGRGEVTVELVFRLDGAGRPWVSGRAMQAVEASCQRCLGRFDRTLEVEIDLCIIRQDEDARELAGLADVLVVEAETVSLADIVEDELLLGLPERLCLEDPCGFAPAMSYPVAGAEAADAAQAADSPFSVLSKLKRADF